LALENQRNLPNKQYFKIGEVCEITGVKQHVLRYWESEFHHIKPKRIGSSQRLYRRLDIDCILTIKKLLKDEGFSIPGAKKFLARKQLDNEQVVLQEDKQDDDHLDLLAEIKGELLVIKKILEY
jgi:DNA-binding transcriptional MerR regulator